jgi:hypothetical protein
MNLMDFVTKISDYLKIYSKKFIGTHVLNFFFDFFAMKNTNTIEQILL